MRKSHILFAAMIARAAFAAPNLSEPWGDLGDGTFANPILAADYSDPDPIRVGDDYYLVSSTFESYPGVTILHSRDLVNWRTIGAAFTQLAATDRAQGTDRMGAYNKGVYAPTIAYHGGRFHIYANLVQAGFYHAWAEKPEGPWHEGFLTDKSGRELRVNRWTDPCAFWDDDGQAYLVASHPGAKYWYSYLFRMSADGTQLLDADVDHMRQGGIAYEWPRGGTLLSPHHSSEGNRFFKKDGWYYFQHIEFTNRGQGEGTYIWRARHPYGTHADGIPGAPGNLGAWEKHTIERVKSRDTARLPGQGGYVTTPDGRWWFVGQFTRDYAFGRPPHLLPVVWKDGWPIIGRVDEKGEGQWVARLEKPIAGESSRLPMGSDMFDSETLDPKWLWNHQPDATAWSLTDRPGFLRLRAEKSVGSRGFFGCRAMVGQRTVHARRATVTAALETNGLTLGQRAGLAHYNAGKDFASLAVKRDAQGDALVFARSGVDEVVVVRLPKGIGRIHLRAETNARDEATFAYSLGGVLFTAVGETVPLKPGNFRGDTTGVFTWNEEAEGGHVDFDFLTYEIDR